VAKRAERRRRSRELERAILGRDVPTAAALIRAGFEIDPRETEHGEDALMLAAQVGSEPLVRLLLERAADVRAIDAVYRRTALGFALWGRSTGVIQALIEAGAEVDARDRGGWTPLMHAVSSGNAEMAGCLLAAGADPDAEAFGDTPRTLAEAQGRGDLAALLLEAGAGRRRAG